MLCSAAMSNACSRADTGLESVDGLPAEWLRLLRRGIRAATSSGALSMVEKMLRVKAAKSGQLLQHAQRVHAEAETKAAQVSEFVTGGLLCQQALASLSIFCPAGTAMALPPARGRRKPEYDHMERQCVAWFREGQGALRYDIEKRFSDAEPGLPTAEQLLAELPRTHAHQRHLQRGVAELPLEAFTGGNALEMLCYLSLQALPRHSRVYSNVHLKGGWHDPVELRGVHAAIAEHAPQLLNGLGGTKMPSRNDGERAAGGAAMVEPSFNRSFDATGRRNRNSLSRAIEASNDVHIDMDVPEAAPGMNDAMADLSLLQTVLGVGKASEASEGDGKASEGDSKHRSPDRSADQGADLDRLLGRVPAAARPPPVATPDARGSPCAGGSHPRKSSMSIADPAQRRAARAARDRKSTDLSALSAHFSELAASHGAGGDSGDAEEEGVEMCEGSPLIEGRARSKPSSPGGRAMSEMHGAMQSAVRRACVHTTDTAADERAAAERDAMAVLSPRSRARVLDQRAHQKRADEKRLATWAEREAEAFRRPDEDKAAGGPPKKGFLRRVLSFGRGRASDSEGDDDDEVMVADGGWYYVDDFGREQGPFSTNRMRAWMRKGYLTNEREARKAHGEQFKPLHKWDELDVLAMQQQAKRVWRKAGGVLTLGRARSRSTPEIEEQLEEIAAAQQQRYARSSFGFDALLLRIPFFRDTPPDAWPADLLDALVLIVELATVDVLSHLIGHFDASNLGIEMLIELMALGFWYMREPRRASEKDGLRQPLFAPYHLAVQRQWGLVMQKLAVWRRSLAAHAYWELTRLVPECSADYAHALQFIDWSPVDDDTSQALSEYLAHQLVLAQKLNGEARLHHTRSLTFTIEQLRLPMLPYELAERPMHAVQDWFGFAMRTAAEADEKWYRAHKDSRRPTSLFWPSARAASEDYADEDIDEEELAEAVSSTADIRWNTEAGGSEVAAAAPLDPAAAAAAAKAAKEEANKSLHKQHVRQQLTLLELSVACVVQSSRDFFLAQSATLIEAIRPHLWEGLSVEPALHCILRLLRGCYYPHQPFWRAGEGMVATSGARLAPVSDAQAVQLRRYAPSMYPGESTHSHLVRLAHLQEVLFPGWGEPRDLMMRAVNKLAESAVGGLVRAAGVGALSELPHATQLVEILAEIVVCMAAHGVQWTVEQIIMQFLKFRKRADASAAYAMVGMRGLALMLDPSTNFATSNARMQREVPRLLAPAIEVMLTSCYNQCGIQRSGLRYYPLPVDTPDGAPPESILPELWHDYHSNIVVDFGKHPLGEKRSADLDTVVAMATSHPAQPPTSTEESALESEWRTKGMLKLLAYRGSGFLGGDTSMLRMRCVLRPRLNLTELDRS